MTQETDKWRQILDNHWTYADVLFLALSYLPPGVNRLNADYFEWSKIVDELKTRYQQDTPELLANIHFSYRLPQPLYSKELDDFFKIAGLANILTITSPSYSVFTISDQTKDIIRSKKEKHPVLSKYIDKIREMSTYFQKLTIQ